MLFDLVDFVHLLIDFCNQNNLEKILVITGKGIRSKAKNDPYKSISMSILKNSVPDFINNDK